MPWSQRERHIANILRQFTPNLIIFEPLVSALYELHMKTTTSCIISIPMCMISHQKYFETFNGYGCGAGDTLWLFAKFLKPKIGLNLSPRNFDVTSWRHLWSEPYIIIYWRMRLEMIFLMRLLKQKSVMFVRSYSGKTFFGLTVITAVVWVNGQIFFFPPREFVGAYLHWKFEVCKCRGCRGIAGERHRQTHTHTLTGDIDPVPISIYFKFWIWNITRWQSPTGIFQIQNINPNASQL